MEERETEKKIKKSEIAEREEKILEFWKEHHIFEKTLEKPADKGEFVFYEGPPTANAAPALHHLAARAFKDVIPRYKTMQGFHVSRKGGWDTHGLPVELQIEKKLGLKSKKEIESFGIAEFNRQCRESVWEYIGLWNQFTERIGYWVDEKNPYVTYHNSYIEALWNIVGYVHDKGLMYKDYKVVPWCPRCGTALSSHELAQGYQDVTDISVYAKFKVVGQENTYLLAWTTTPWTLPGNVGLAVGEDIEYVKIQITNDAGSEFYILAKERLVSVMGENAYEIVEEINGRALVSHSYEPLYPYLAELDSKNEKLENAYKVYAADFVTTTDGTGIVHTAVMYGQEDFELGTKVGLPKVHLVKEDGHFLDNMGFLSGRYVKETDEKGKPTLAVDILDDLKKRNLFFKQENVKHSYPHCWRCKTPLIYYARDSWYIRVSSLRDTLQDENEKINWEPDHIKHGRFGEWLREAKDWAISRERYWGTPLPVWVNAKNEVTIIRSVDDLKKYAKKSGNKYVVMRHGQTENNVKGLWNFDSSIPDPLTETGREQVKNNAASLKKEKIDFIIASTFPRSHETAELVAEAIGLSKENIIVDARIGEWNAGTDFNHKPVEDFFVGRNASENRYTYKAPGGESYADVLTRAGEFLYDIENTHSGKNILIVSHGAPTRALSLVAEGFSYDTLFERTRTFVNFDNAEIRQIDFAPLPHNEHYELDLHRPYIDDVALVDAHGEPLIRAKEVMDVWFDSGAMPFAQHAEQKDKNIPYPADFISEAIDQTRGWFYTLLCVGILMDKGTPYKNVICLGHILDKEGKKMSKSIGNIVNPWQLMDTYGVDALRLWMYSVNQPGDSKNFDEKTVDEIIKKIFNPLTNIHTLLALYESGVERMNPTESTDVLDVWILARLSELVSTSTKSLDEFKVFEPVRMLREFVQDFSTWYVRRSRERLKNAGSVECIQAVSVTEHVLVEISKFLAPFAPFYSEWLYTTITKNERMQSVHLELWPAFSVFDEEVIENMATVRETVTQALELRQKSGVKVRQPLQKLHVKSEQLKGKAEYISLIADEINVKEVVFDANISGEVELDTTLTDELREEGMIRDIIRAIQDARKSENLTPSEAITLTMHADESVQKLVEKYKAMIVAPTLTREVVFVSEKQPYVVEIGGGEVSISIEK